MGLSEEIADYWSRRSSGFSDAVIDECVNGDGRVRDMLVSELGIGPGSRVLDAGSGPGFFEMVLEGTGAELHAVDFSEAMVEKARENAPSAIVRRMDVQSLEYPDGFFDAVVSRNVLWSLTDPAKAYSEIVRVMKPGAKALVIDGNYYLGLYDERYARQNEPCPRNPGTDRPGSHAKFNRGDVDFREMENLALGLPLSRVLRPVWDLEVLCGLPVSEVGFRISSRRTDGFRRIGQFTITFTRCSDDE